jgi:pSer/pThr/pTyr-binding forkhead associated (FHA) protein
MCKCILVCGLELCCGWCCDKVKGSHESDEDYEERRRKANVWAQQNQSIARGNMLKVKILTGPHASKLSFRFKMSAKKERVVIGRDPDVDDLVHLLVLEKDDDASSEHGAIILKEGEFWYEDLDSTNGSKVGIAIGNKSCFAKVDPKVPVKLVDGTEIEISCNTKVVILLVEAGGAPEECEMCR